MCCYTRDGWRRFILQRGVIYPPSHTRTSHAVDTGTICIISTKHKGPAETNPAFVSAQYKSNFAECIKKSQTSFVSESFSGSQALLLVSGGRPSNPGSPVSQELLISGPDQGAPRSGMSASTATAPHQAVVTVKGYSGMPSLPKGVCQCKWH